MTNQIFLLPLKHKMLFLNHAGEHEFMFICQIIIHNSDEWKIHVKIENTDTSLRLLGSTVYVNIQRQTQIYIYNKKIFQCD